ncbi:MerR family transcriptional regulator [Actinomycetospora straminea]|uniref:MerR family transcriptional regulator n=1 Tax=Actinomycetospora straminea TaxID=663607 RepID=A0ABP9EE39_9PSEU|nr:MerR family transcriptional regulator [Actinomycetospora straminea]MDD7932202.1 MerR family transcriptional regulator [Actinomycetospora straminea]
MDTGDEGRSTQDMTVDVLARRAGMTVRNVRAHAARGLLPSPRLRGRTGYYGPEHLARLELITQLQEQGFSLSAIERLVTATPRQSAEEALSQYLHMLAPWAPEPALEMAAAELPGWLGVEVGDETWRALVDAGLIVELDGGRARIPNPGLVRAGAEAVRLGMPAADLIVMREELTTHVGAVTARFVDLFRRTVWAEYVGEGLPADRTQQVRDVVGALQPVAAQALLATFRESMPAAISLFLDEASEDFERGRDPEGPAAADS